jgi:hypothetical protein
MTRTRILSTTAIASILGVALPAFAQAPAPAPMYAPAPAPMMAPAPAPEAGSMPAAPMVAPRAADDMTGSVGFGAGVVAGTSLVATDDTVFMKYWMSDGLAIIPRLNFGLTKIKGTDVNWGFSPAVLASFTLLKGASTRFNAGLGLGLDLAKGRAPAAAASTDTYIGIYIPVVLDVEHFFARWFSMGVGTQFRFLDYWKQGDGWQMDIALSNVSYLGYLTFYTD